MKQHVPHLVDFWARDRHVACNDAYSEYYRGALWNPRYIELRVYIFYGLPQT